MTTLTATILIALILPFLVLLWFTESKATRINRMRSNGWTWKRIANYYKVKSPSTVRRWAMT